MTKIRLDSRLEVMAYVPWLRPKIGPLRFLSVNRTQGVFSSMYVEYLLILYEGGGAGDNRRHGQIRNTGPGLD